MPAIMLNTRDQSTLILTFANREANQTLSVDMLQNGLTSLANAERDDSIRTIILTASGADFCRGRLLANEVSATRIAQEIDYLNSWVDAIRGCPKPVIAAVEGAAQDAGFALALACDYIIAGSSAQFSSTQTKIGLAPDGGISWLLSKSLPRHLATELLFEGKPLLAARLQQFGVIKQVVPDGSAYDSALRFARNLAQLPPLALERVKGLINEAQSNTLNQQFEAERHAFLECLRHNEAQEGIAAMREKRKPKF